MISILAAPLPDISNLMRAWLGNPPIPPPDKHLFFYSRGTWALTEGIRALLSRRHGAQGGCVWFPDYFCAEPLQLIQPQPYEIRFYPVRRTLEPDWDFLEQKASQPSRPDIFVLVDYFGLSNNLNCAVDFCRKYQIDLIEDKAHVFEWGQSTPRHVVVYSPRKVLPIPRGGMLSAPDDLHSLMEKPPMVVNHVADISWVFKKIIQKFLVAIGQPCHRLQMTNTPSAWAAINTKKDLSHDISPFALRLFLLGQSKFDIIRQRRQRNYLYLLEHLARELFHPVFSALERNFCPYAFPVVVQEGRNYLLENLLRKGIPASSWPDLPPEVERDRERHQDALWVQRHIILFPVHQSLSERQMEYMTQIANSFVRGSSLDAANGD